MPSKNMIPKGKRRQSVKAAYRLHRDAVREQELAAVIAAETPSAPAPLPPETAEPTPAESFEVEELEKDGTRALVAAPQARGMRLDAYLSRVFAELSRSRIQTLIAAKQVTVQGLAVPASTPLKGGEQIEVLGDPMLPPLHGEPEDIALDIAHEDAELAIINKPAGMMVHAGSGSAEHNRGTLVNALLFHFGKGLSELGGNLRPGIVHRLDKETSGLIVVAKNDRAHKLLGEQFASRSLQKTYTALVHGTLKGESGTVDLPISRDLVRRTRMTTRRADGRHAITHWTVLERFDTAFGPFTLVELRIETGRTHQIRVHMQALGHPVVGDTVYGAAEFLRTKPAKGSPASPEAIRLGRNFLHAAQLRLQHPTSGKALEVFAPLPPELEALLTRLREAAL